ncbi:MAG: hypothetical protein Q9184_002006 [Pyrenodesmia sp. 2 TL-2023]
MPENFGGQEQKSNDATAVEHSQDSKITVNSNPHPDFVKVEASRLNWRHDDRWHLTKTVNPGWKLGDVANDEGDILKRDHVEIDPYADGRPAVFNYKLLIFAGGFSNAKDTLANLAATKECTINIISEHFIEAANATSINAPLKCSRVKEAIFSAEGNLFSTQEFESRATPGKKTGVLAIVEGVRFWMREVALNEDKNLVDPAILRPRNLRIRLFRGPNHKTMSTASVKKMLGGGLHGHFPVEAEIVGYLANTYSVPALLGLFAAGWIIVLGATNLLIRHHNPSLGSGDKAALLWFVLRTPAEYAWSDSRYLTSDPFVLCMETVTAFCWGPLSFCVALMIAFQHPLRHPLQAMVCLGQIYGDILYYATSMFDHYYKGVTYSRPEAWYFWGYYFFMNFIWIVIPGYLLYRSVEASGRAFQALARQSESEQGNGHTKKRN